MFIEYNELKFLSRGDNLEDLLYQVTPFLARYPEKDYQVEKSGLPTRLLFKKLDQVKARPQIPPAADTKIV